MKLKTIKTRVLPIPRQDGNHTRGSVKILLADADPVEFCIEVPDWLASPLSLRLRNGHIARASLEDCVRAYELALLDYTQWLRTSAAKPVLLIRASYAALYDGNPGGRRGDFHLSGLPKPCVALGYERAFDVNGKIHRDTNGKPGEVRHLDSEVVVLPYTPELEDSIKAIQASLSAAIRKLDAMLEGSAEAVSARLLASAGLLRLTKD